MKAAVVIRMKEGYLVVERNVESISIDELLSGSVVSESGTYHDEKLGRNIISMLNPPKKEESPDE